MKPTQRALAASICALIAVALAASPALARTTSNTKDGRPNILVIMTDDQAAADLSAMPNTASLLTAQGALFQNAVDSFPLCCPSRATFISGQYAHNHGVGGNFFPYGWYGMSNRANTLPAWLKASGYYTAAVGKWLNGYGAGKSTDKDSDGNPLTTNGEIPAGFDNWNGALDVSAYDYFNFKLNQNGKVNSWGDSKYAQALVDFAEIQVIPPASKSISTVLNWSAKYFKGSPSDPTTYGYQGATGCDSASKRFTTKGCYSPDVTAGISDSIIKSQRTSSKPFFLWWSPAAPHREDVNGGIRNGYRNNVHYRGTASNPKVEDTTKLVPDPRPAPRYASTKWDWTKITGKPNYDAAPTNKPIKQQLIMANPMSTIDRTRLEVNYSGRLSSLKAVDDGVKKILDTLKATKQLDNTLILFTSDNGWLQGEHRIPGDKYLPYEESIRITFIMKGPGIPKNRKVTNLVSNIDFAATLLDVAKATPGRVLDGMSLIGLAKGTANPTPRAIALEATAPLFADASMPQQWDQPYKGVRTDRWKYVEWGTGEKELYDLQADPYELTNLADNSLYAAIQSALAAKMNALKDCAGANCQVAQ